MSQKLWRQPETRNQEAVQEVAAATSAAALSQFVYLADIVSGG